MSNKSWIDICSVDDLEPNGGVSALVGDLQIALFTLADGQVFALDNYDPFSRAMVLSRGIIGDIKGTAIVASPIYKQYFCLKTGQCLDDQDVMVRSWPVKIENQRVLLKTEQQKIAA